MCQFAHIHNHSEYSMLDGLSSIDSYIREASKMKYDALAITDHGNMHAAVELYNQAKAANIHPVMGCEFYATPFGTDYSDKTRSANHMLILAQTQDGYQNMLRLAKNSYEFGMYYKPRITVMDLEKYNKGLIVTSGCMAAHIPSAIQDGNLAQAESMFAWYRETFTDRFFVELQVHPGISELNDINVELLRLAKKFNTKVILTNDSHYARAEDASVHDILLCVQTKGTIHDAKRFKFTDNEYYLKSPDQMVKTFLPYMDEGDIQKYMLDTYELAHSCHSNPAIDITPHIPVLNITGMTNADDFLRQMTYEKITNVYPDWKNRPDVIAQVEEELKIIKDTKFAAYFLIIWDICEFANKSGIGFNTRGSAAGSIINYIIGVSFVDPIEKKLMFSRFLNTIPTERYDNLGI